MSSEFIIEWGLKTLLRQSEVLSHHLKNGKGTVWGKKQKTMIMESEVLRHHLSKVDITPKKLGNWVRFKDIDYVHWGKYHLEIVNIEWGLKT